MAKKSESRIKEAKSYYRAAESVSKPLAFLMLFFVVSFLASMAIGLFLVGRWGYGKIVNVEEPITTITTPVQDTSPSTTVVVDPPKESSIVNSYFEENKSRQPETSKIPTSTSLPDTGASFLQLYITIIAIGTLAHLIYSKIKARS